MSDVLRWVVDQYRSKLLEIDRNACHEVDMVMLRIGQGWVCDQTVVDPDELVTARVMESRYGIGEAAIRALARRYGIEIRGKDGFANLYRVGDILSARAAKKSFDHFR